MPVPFGAPRDGVGSAPRFQPTHSDPLKSLLRAALTALAFGAATLGPLASAQTPPSPGERAILSGEDPALGATIPELGQSASPVLTGQPIRRVEVVAAGGRWLITPTLKTVRAGEAASPEAARRAMREILATGRFARANVEAFPEGDGVVLRVNVLPRRLIATIQVSGGSLDTAETLDASEIAEGGEITAPMLATIAARVRRHYENHGFPAAKVVVDATDTDDPDRVVLSIEIRPGLPRTVTERIFVIDKVAEREAGSTIASYRVGKGARVEASALADADRELTEALKLRGFFRAEVRHALRSVGPYSYLYVYVTPGARLVPAFDGNRAYDADQLEKALNLEKAPDARPGELIDRLRSFYVARGFYDAEISMEERGKADAPVHHLAFTIREHEQVRVARRVFPCLGPGFTPDEVGREIDSFLDEELPGGETFSPADPRTMMKILGPTEGAGRRGVAADLNPAMTYAPETYERAVKHLKDLFHSKGYLNAVVGPIALLRATCSKYSPPGQCLPVAAPQGKAPRVAAKCLRDSLGLPLPEPPVPDALTCRPDPARNVECSREVTLRIPIALGPRTTLWDLAFEGNRSFSEKDLERHADLTLGSPLSTVDLEAARIRVADAYRARGFAYAEVRTAVEPSPDRTRARVRFYVIERDRVIVSGFVVKGAVRTNEKLILGRLVLKKDRPYQQDWVRQSEERIATLGTFSSVSVGLEDAEVPQRRKRVVITVVEQRAQYLEPQVGFSTGDGIRFAVEYGHRNIAGQAISLVLRVQLGYLFSFLIPDGVVRENLDQLSILDRLQRRNTATITFREFGMGPLVSLSLDGIDIRNTQRDYALTREAFVPTITYRSPRLVSRRLPAPYFFTTQLGFSAELNDVTIYNTCESETDPEKLALCLASNPCRSEPDPQKRKECLANILRVPEGRTVAIAERVAFTWDFRDNPFNATRGGLISTSLEHVNAFPAGTSKDNPAKDISHFLRFTGRIAGYIRFTEKGLALALSLSAGYNLQLSSESKTYPDRLFFLGGVDSLRSFLIDSLVPEDRAKKVPRGVSDPVELAKYVPIRGGDVAINPRAELRIPITEVFQTGIFLDTGNVWVDPAQIDATLRYALGAGLRVSTPIGPLAFDYGFNLLRRSWEDVGAFHFSIGLF